MLHDLLYIYYSTAFNLLNSSSAHFTRIHTYFLLLLEWMLPLCWEFATDKYSNTSGTQPFSSSMDYA